MDVVGIADPYFHATIDDGQIKYTYIDFILIKKKEKSKF
jgi:hypothetical protein